MTNNKKQKATTNKSSLVGLQTIKKIHETILLHDGKDENTEVNK